MFTGRVNLCGLVGAAEFNDKEGTAQSFDAKTMRMHVKLKCGKDLSVKLENCELVMGEELQDAFCKRDFLADSKTPQNVRSHSLGMSVGLERV